MEWIKKNPHQLALALLSAGLIGASVVVLLNAQSLPEKFQSVRTDVPPQDNVPPLNLEPVQEATAKLTKPAQWNPNPAVSGSLLVADRYYIDKNGKPTKPIGGEGIHNDSLTGQPIPNKWFLDNNLPLLDPTAAKQDPDRDGFLNEDEWREKTDPNDSKSHPAYHTKLFVKQYIRVPFRLKFQAYDLDPKHPEKNTFQINTMDLRQPTEFLPIGATISRTKFKVDSFAQKNAMNPKTGVEEDVSELTLLNTETNEKVTLILNKITDSPDSIALFSYTWPQPPQEIRVKKLGQFALLPNKDIYKLLDIKETEAVIQLPSGEKYTVQRLPQ